MIGNQPEDTEDPGPAGLPRRPARCGAFHRGGAGRGGVAPAGRAVGLDAVLHMIEETARHAGHLDIARELTDGQTGLGPR